MDRKAEAADGSKAPNAIASTALRRKYTRPDHNDPISRLMKTSEKCVVQGFTYGFMHRLEGKWSGEWQEMSLEQNSQKFNLSPISAVKAVSTKVVFENAGHWTLREISAAEDGAAAVYHLRLAPVDDGVLVVTVVDDDDPASHRKSGNPVSSLVLKEREGSAILEQRHPVTGRLCLSELIVISAEGVLIRTTNMFGDAGDLLCVAVSRQSRVPADA